MSSELVVLALSAEQLKEIVRAAIRDVTTLAAMQAKATEWLDERDAAALAGCHVRTLRRLSAPAHRVGRARRYRRVELEHWIASGAAK